LQEWTTQWHNTIKENSSFSPTDCLPPSLRPHKHFWDTNHRTFGCLIQCRTGHAFLGEYYSTFIPAESPSCPCGEPIQTREHIIASCPNFESERNTLRTASKDLVITDILGTEKGIEALIEFLNHTDAFKKSTRTNSHHTNLQLILPSA
ncbi:hypothetical protein EDD17DRAFT_1487346, partial [Pisolithus thermaeus]